MRQKLCNSKELNNVLIQGKVQKSSDSLTANDGGFWPVKGAMGYVISEKKNEPQATMFMSVPFKLTDTNDNKIIVKDIHLALGFSSLTDTVFTKCHSVYSINNSLISGTGCWILKFDSSLAIMGKVMFQDHCKTGSKMVFYPTKVGPTVESL